MSAAQQFIHSLGCVWVGVPMCTHKMCNSVTHRMFLHSHALLLFRACEQYHPHPPPPHIEWMLSSEARSTWISSDVLGLYPPFLPSSHHAPVLTVPLPPSLPLSLPSSLPPFPSPSLPLFLPAFHPPSWAFSPMVCMCVCMCVCVCVSACICACLVSACACVCVCVCVWSCWAATSRFLLLRPVIPSPSLHRSFPLPPSILPPPSLDPSPS